MLTNSPESSALTNILSCYNTPSIATALRRAAAGFKESYGLNELIKAATAQGFLDSKSEGGQTALDLALDSKMFKNSFRRFLNITSLLNAGAKYQEQDQKKIIDCVQREIKKTEQSSKEDLFGVFVTKQFAAMIYLSLMTRTKEPSIFDLYQHEYINLFKPKFSIAVEKNNVVRILTLPEFEREFDIIYCEMMVPSDPETAKLLLAWCGQNEAVIINILRRLENVNTPFKIKWMGDDLDYGLFANEAISPESIPMVYGGKLVDEIKADHTYECEAYIPGMSQKNYALCGKKICNLFHFGQHVFEEKDFPDAFDRRLAQPIVQQIIDDKRMFKVAAHLDGFFPPIFKCNSNSKYAMKIPAGKIIAYSYGLLYWGYFCGGLGKTIFPIKLFNDDGDIVTEHTYLLLAGQKELIKFDKILRDEKRSISIAQSQDYVYFIDGLVKDGVVNTIRMVVPIHRRDMIKEQRDQLAYLDSYCFPNKNNVLHKLPASELTESALLFLQRCCSSEAAWEKMKKARNASGKLPNIPVKSLFFSHPTVEELKLPQASDHEESKFLSVAKH